MGLFSCYTDFKNAVALLEINSPAMAKKISDEIIRLNIIVNGNDAQKEILDLEKANAALIEKRKELTAQEKKLVEAYNKTRKENEAQRRELNELQKQMDKVSSRHDTATLKLKEIEAQSGKTSKEYKKQQEYIKTLEGEYEKLWNAVDKSSTKLVKTGEAFQKANNEMVAAKTEIAQLNNQIDANSNKIQELYGNLSITDLTMGQLQKRAIVLRTALKNMSADDVQFEKLSAELNAVKTRLAELDGRLKLSDLSMADLQVRAQQLEDALKLDLPEEKLQKYTAELAAVNERMSELNGTMDINEMSMRQLENELARLNTEFKNTKPNAENYAQFSGKIKAAELRLAELKGTLKVTDMTMVQLEAEAKRLATAMQSVPASSNEYLQMEADLGKVQARMAQINNNYNLLEMSATELKNRATLLQNALDNVRGNPEKIEEYKKQLEEVNEQMEKLKGDGDKAKWSIGGLADTFNRYAALAATLVASLTGVVLSIQKMIDFNAKLSDKMADVQKTTGMTKREVDELSKSFGLLHTRTSRMDLLGIAEVGGKLGIAKEEIGDFVRVMNKASVALADSFEGGPEVVADKLGKIKNLYKELRESGVEASFEAVGSALNDLGAAGTASESNVSEFVQRVGSIPEAFKPSIQEALGLGAAFEESGLKAEIAGNNYGKLITVASKNIDAFAKVMGRPAAELKNLINTNPTEFFLQFSASLKGLEGTDLSKILDKLKLNDEEVKRVLGAASQNVQLFRDKIELAKVSMADATSLTTEYEIKNKTLGATLDRLKKVVTGWFTSDSVVAFLDSAVNWLAKFVGAVEDSDSKTQAWRNTFVFAAKVLAIVVTSLFSYTTATKLAALWSSNLAGAVSLSNITFRIAYARLVIQEVATKALALAQALLSFNITSVRTAYQALTVAMGMNPFGALLAVITAVIVAFVTFGQETNKATALLQAQVEIQKQVADQTNKTKTRINELISIIKDENATYGQKKKALEELKKIGGEYLATLTQENILTAEGKRLIDRYIASIDQLAKAKALVNVKSKLEERKLEGESKVLALSLEKKANTNKGLFGGSFDDGKFFGMGGRTKGEIQEEIDAEKQTLKVLGLQIEDLNGQRAKQIEKLRQSIARQNAELKKTKKGSDEYKKLLLDIKTNEQTLNTLLGLAPASDKGQEVGQAIVPGDDKKDKEAQRLENRKRKMRLDAMNQSLEDAKKAAQDSLDLERQATDARLALMMEGFDKEEALENENHKRKLEDLQKMLVSEVEFAKLEESINDPTLPVKQRGALVHIRESWLEKNKHINNLIEIEQGRHQLAVATIEEKAETKRIQDLADKFNTETTEREAAHLQEMAALGKNQAAKERLQREYDEKELQRQTDFLKELLSEKQKILAGQNNEIDLSMLTPDQVKAMEEEIAKLKKQLAELAQQKADLQNSKGFGAAAGDVFGNKDILGFTAEQWATAFSSLDTVQKKLQATVMVVQGLQNLWGAYNDYLAANENASLRKYEKGQDARKKKLKWQLDNGYISQAQYKREVETMDAELDKKKAEIEYRQAKRQKAMAAAQVVISTAQAIMGIWAQFQKFDMGIAATIASAAVGALGALQLATVLKTPLPAKGYEEGLYPNYVKREQDGKMFRAGYGGKTRSGMVNKPTYFLAGENGPEMIIDSRAYRQLSPDTKDMLVRELRGIKGFEQGYYNKDVTGSGTGRIEVPAQNNSNNEMLSLLVQLVERNTTVMERIEQTGLIAYLSRDPREINELIREMDRIKKSKSKAEV